MKQHCSSSHHLVTLVVPSGCTSLLLDKASHGFASYSDNNKIRPLCLEPSILPIVPDLLNFKFLPSASSGLPHISRNGKCQREERVSLPSCLLIPSTRF